MFLFETSSAREIEKEYGRNLISLINWKTMCDYYNDKQPSIQEPKHFLYNKSRNKVSYALSRIAHYFWEVLCISSFIKRWNKKYDKLFGKFWFTKVVRKFANIIQYRYMLVRHAIIAQSINIADQNIRLLELNFPIAHFSHNFSIFN